MRPRRLRYASSHAQVPTPLHPGCIVLGRHIRCTHSGSRPRCAAHMPGPSSRRAPLAPHQHTGVQMRAPPPSNVHTRRLRRPTAHPPSSHLPLARVQHAPMTPSAPSLRALGSLLYAPCVVRLCRTPLRRPVSSRSAPVARPAPAPVVSGTCRAALAVAVHRPSVPPGQNWFS